jgi:BirA family biotin operon repressor/biotin-[acetyl-CoA-carboxylase] ligase
LSFLSRIERFDVVPSTNDVVAAWLADGVPEVALAITDHQTAGRGRGDRTWIAPPGAALLLSLGFRPPALPAAAGWRLGAVVAVSMAEATESVTGLPDGSIGLKWPNDLVAVTPHDDEPRKLAGILGEATLDDGRVVSAVVGIGLDCDWAAADFPPGLADRMTSLREISGRRVDREAILIEFLESLDRRYRALRRGDFDAAGWAARQRTTGRRLVVDTGDASVRGTGAGVDPGTGALLVDTAEGTVAVATGDVVSCRFAEPATAPV